MELEATETTQEGDRNRPNLPSSTNRRARSGKGVGRSSATPWDLDTRVADPRTAVVAPAGQSIDDVARSYLGLSQNDAGLDRAAIDQWQKSLPEHRGAVDLFRELHLSDPAEASRVARGVTSLPEPGENFLGFRLIDEIGRGAFGRVYLAQQGDLADRYVALKVSTELKAESQTLAQLQHTNIVPIFSVHHARPFQAVCMPFYGVTTLKDVCEELERSGEAPASGRSLLMNLSTRRCPSRPEGSRVQEARDSASPAVLDDASSARSEGSNPSTGLAEGTSTAPQPLSNTLRMIGELPYDHAVLWMGSRLADGLAHAHERGILHRDLKPANILLTDDGQPMLLDFNLAQQTRGAGAVAAASVGGTLPYMAPEHLAAFRGDDVKVDERSDLYALGIILFELLARRHPFPIHDDSTRATIDRMILERQESSTRIRPWDDRVSPAAESIIRHCLEPDPARRYQSVRDLHEDLERHLANLPLKHALEPSVGERGRKFLRRNPRMGLWVGIGVALIALVSTLVVLASRGQEFARLKASEAFDAFQNDFGKARYVLSVRAGDRSERNRGYELVRKALSRYRVFKNPAWLNEPDIVNLPPGDRARLVEDVAETLQILAEGEADADADADGDGAGPLARPEHARSGLALNNLALACFDERPPPHSLLSQRLGLLKRLGQDAEAKVVLARLDQVSMQTAPDFLNAATAHLIKGDLDKARTLADEATQRDPRNFWAWFTLGVSLDRKEQPAEALSCFQTCVALRPDYVYSWFNRGLCQLRVGNPARARHDFDRAIELKPDWYEPYLNRALARRDLGDYQGTAEDLTGSLARGATETRIYFLRAAALAKLGDLSGAKKDREAGLAKAPVDAMSWIARAYERIETEPAGALADFENALKLDPKSLQALHMRAHVLALAFGKLDDAAVILDRAIELYPDYVPARAFRGVIHAIRGRRELAHKDAQEARWRDSSPRNLYQLAGIYATTSRQVPEDRLEAYLLLHTALRQGYGFDLIAGDSELDPIRDQPEFRRLVESARLARAGQPSIDRKP